MPARIGISSFGGGKGFIAVTASRNAVVVTDQYLRGCDGTPMNQTPFIVEFDAIIIAIGATCNVADTWTAEVHRDLVPIPGATLTVSADISNYSDDYSIEVNAGDKLMIYMSGTGVNRPSVNIILKRRD